MEKKENEELKQLDEFLNELEYQGSGYADPSASTGLQQMKGQLIKNIGLEGASVQEMGDDHYQLTYKGKKESYDFENLLKKLVELATAQTHATKATPKTNAPTPVAPPPAVPAAAAPAPAPAPTGAAPIQV
jgi:hypothetical protein